MRPSILIVDDSLTVRADLEDAFAEQGMPAIACATVAAARAALDNRAIGLVILDVMLPDGDGVDLLREIRAMPGRERLPVLMLTTEVQIHDRIRGLQMGSDDYVGKPYDRDYVIARASELLGADAAAADAPGAILVIDDSLTFREQLCESLREQGYTVASAASGEEGLRSIALRRPAAVVVDGVLPGIDGASVVRTLRLDAALRHIPCILLTGSDDERDELRALDSGADAFVRKDEDLGMILARVAAVLRQAGGNAPRPAASLLRATRILAVDDSLSYLHAQADVLRGEGYDMVLAESAEQALEILRVQAVDCILLDRVMPGMGGTEACRLIKADPATRDIPLIMLTAMEDREAMIEGLGTGADDYVLKSSEFDVLKARVRAQLRRKQFEDEGRRIRAEQTNKELEAAEMRAARELAESRSELLAILERKNTYLELTVGTLQESQAEIAEKNRQLEAASRMKSEFLSNMSHELRTPLNAIIGFSDLLRGGVVGPLAAKQHECVSHIVTSGKHLLALINDILDLSKVEAGKMSLDLDPFEPNATLRACLDIVADAAGKRGIGLDFRPCAGERPVMADLRKFRQIVYNLLSNAVKFSPDGGTVSLSSHRLQREEIGRNAPDGMTARLLPLADSLDQDWLEIRVRDHGIGIKPDDLAHLFETFHQIDSSLARRHEGSGLGLALVSRMTALHGGTVGVASGVGRGSQFSVWLPWRAPAQGQAPQAAGTMQAVRKRVLVIDEDARAAQLMRRHFETLGLDVVIAPDAELAMAVTESRLPDLIAIDIELTADGWHILQAVQSEPRLAAVPVVLLGMQLAQARALALGAVRVLSKPAPLAALNEALGAAARTVLIVDAGADAAARLAAQLEARGHKTVCRADGQSALAFAAYNAVDLVVADMRLPDMTCFDLLAELHAAPATHATPVRILVAPPRGETGPLHENEAYLHAMQDGAFDSHQLLRAVRQALQQAPSGRTGTPAGRRDQGET